MFIGSLILKSQQISNSFLVGIRHLFRLNSLYSFSSLLHLSLNDGRLVFLGLQSGVALIRLGVFLLV